MAVDDFKRNGLWAKTANVGKGVQVSTKAYQAYRNILTRTTDVDNNPNYIGVTVSDEFRCFQTFADWYTVQVGYNCEKYHVDKDILSGGRQLYSRETCLLIPAAFNLFFVANDVNRSRNGIGACFDKARNLYLATIKIDGKSKHIGRFETAKEATDAYLNAKNLEKLRWLQRFRAGEFEIDIRAYVALKNWQVKEREPL